MSKINKNYSGKYFLITVLLPIFSAVMAWSQEDLKNYPQEVKKPVVDTSEVVSEDIEPKKNETVSSHPKSTRLGETTLPSPPATPTSANTSQNSIPTNEKIGLKLGMVRDSGRFLTELKSHRQGIDVYLENSAGKFPLTEASSVEGHLYIGKKEYELKFRPVPAQKKFFAVWPETVRSSEVISGEISVVLLPIRERIVGTPVLFKLHKLY